MMVFDAASDTILYCAMSDKAPGFRVYCRGYCTMSDE